LLSLIFSLMPLLFIILLLIAPLIDYFHFIDTFRQLLFVTHYIRWAFHYYSHW
jgi:hypothetical protein